MTLQMFFWKSSIVVLPFMRAVTVVAGIALSNAGQLPAHSGPSAAGIVADPVDERLVVRRRGEGEERVDGLLGRSARDVRPELAICACVSALVSAWTSFHAAAGSAVLAFTT